MFKKYITSIDQTQSFFTNVTYPRNVNIFHGHYPEVHELHNLKLLIDEKLKTNLDKQQTNIYAEKTEFNVLNDSEVVKNFLGYVHKQISLSPGGEVIKFWNEMFVMETWGNRMNKGDYIKNHVHNCLHLILYLTEGVELFLPELQMSIVPKPGDWYLLPPHLLHYSNKSISEEARYSFVCNLTEKANWDRLKELNLY